MTDWKGALTKVLKEGTLPPLGAPEKSGIINLPPKTPRSAGTIMRTIGKSIFYLLAFILISVITNKAVGLLFGKYGDNYFKFIFLTELFLIWNFWLFNIRGISKGYKITSAVICSLLFIGLLTSVRDDNRAIELGYRSSSALELARSGDFKDQAALDRALAQGFDKRSDLEAAEKAGYHDKASYDKFLQAQKAAADEAQQREAEAQKQAEQAADEEKQRADDAAEKAQFAAMLRNAKALDDKYDEEANSHCGSGADNYLRSIAAHDFAWDDEARAG